MAGQERIFFSEWTDLELKNLSHCSCACHSEPGVYATNEQNPCSVCGHINEYGYFPGALTEGWVEYWRSDKAGEYKFLLQEKL